MPEDRFETDEENMADMMAQMLPREDAMKYFHPFYGEAWNWYIDHLELMNLFSKIPESQDAFRECLQLCKKEGSVELFAAALALRKKKLQKDGVALLY